MPLSPITQELDDYNVTVFAGDENRQRACDAVSASGTHDKITSTLVPILGGRRLREESSEPPEMQDVEDERPAKRTRIVARDHQEDMVGVEEQPAMPQSIAAVAAVTSLTISTISSRPTSNHGHNISSTVHFLSRSSSTTSLSGTAAGTGGSSSASNGIGPVNHPFFFESGDLTLNVENSFFRIHSEKLASVCGFYNMLKPRQPGQRLTYQEIVGSLGPDCQSQVDGTPLLKLEHDRAKDWMVALEAIYEPMSFQVRPIVFDTLASALRVSTKYYIRFLRDWAIAQMRTTWPSNLDQMVPMALPHAAEAISLARECNVPEILPAAFYALSIQKWRANADGARAHNVLSPDDLRRLVMGREALQDLLVEIVVAPLSVPAPPPPPPGTSGSSKGVARADADAEIATMDKPQSVMPPPPPAHPAFVFCSLPATCRARLELLWRTRLAPDATRPWNTWVLRELHRMATMQLSLLDETTSELGYPPSAPSTTASPAEVVDENGAPIPAVVAPTPEPLVCKRCWEENRRLAVWRLNFLRDAIPKWFAL